MVWKGCITGEIVQVKTLPDILILRILFYVSRGRGKADFEVVRERTDDEWREVYESIKKRV